MQPQRTASDIVLFYPGASLTDQVAGWSERHPQCSLEVSFAKTVPGIRQALSSADAAVLDATADPGQAMAAFSQAVAKLGAYSVAVYTERMHEWLELSVRIRGALLLLGPMDSSQWEGLFDRLLPGTGRPCPAELLSQRPARDPARSGNRGTRERLAARWLLAGFHRPKTGVT